MQYKTEEMLRKYLFSKGLRFRKNDGRYTGKPDIVLPKYKAIVFVNGCFWHRHEGCKYNRLPKSNIEYWLTKLDNNVRRDHKNSQLLMHAGWKVIVVWECELKNNKREETLISVYESNYANGIAENKCFTRYF